MPERWRSLSCGESPQFFAQLQGLPKEPLGLVPVAALVFDVSRFHITAMPERSAQLILHAVAENARQFISDQYISRKELSH